MSLATTIVDALNRNSGALQAIATLVLVVMTAWYVVLTRRVAQASRREVEFARLALEQDREAARQEREIETYNYLGELWYQTLDACAQNPRFLLPQVTRSYHKRMGEEERALYDTYCYKAWAYVEDIVAKGFHRDPQFLPIIQWTMTFHGNWLDLNPTFFTLNEFWEAVEEAREQPQLPLIYEALPTKDGDIDWDLVAPNYFDYIFSPFAPEMVTSCHPHLMRNRLVAELQALPLELSRDWHVGDFGCGPGNLLPHIAGRVSRVTGIDKSKAALGIAAERGRELGVDFSPYEADYRFLSLPDRFDLAVSVNSILPQSRADVVPILEVIREHLRLGATFMSILPSYDTNQYLRRLWREHNARQFGDESHADRIVKAFAKSKLADDVNFLYAEDGCTQQAYHTPESIETELPAAGFEIVRPLEKVYYPWDLARRFDYGYFPSANEEIWDWFVIARAV